MALMAEDIKNGAKLSATDLIIVFMGPTGSGRSNIIDTLANQPGRRAGSRLKLCTTEVRAVRVFNHPVHGDRLVLVDTPGFDDTKKSDLEILQMVRNWLNKTYERRIKLAGIIYLHRITDNRMAGSPHRNLHLFGELCGDQAVKKVMLVTTMWDIVQSDTGDRRENELFEKYWKTMINYGASNARFLNSADSAWEIIDLVHKQHSKSTEVPLQGFVDLKSAPNETREGMDLKAEDTKSKLLGTDVIIAFMGPTGSGKSNIIDILTNQPGRRAGSRLESCTTEIRAVRVFNHTIHGDRLVFVDTPGFDDTNKSDLEILQMVGSWLQKTYEKDIKLAGIIYLHRITDSRVAGSAHRNLRMFGKLCGDQAVKKVVLVTTMWDKLQLNVGVRREKELFENYWGKMIRHGASTARFLNSADSAWKIIDLILEQHSTEVLLLQEELVDLERALSETQAGKTLYSDLQRLLVEQRDTIRSLAEQAREEGNPHLARQLEAELKRIQKDFDKTFNEIKKLKIPFGKRLLLLLFGKKSRGRSIHF